MAKAKILLVDDEDGIVKSVAIRLRANGYEVSVAMDGYEALNRVHLDKPDLILLDIGLPRLDGHEVTRILRDSPKTRSIPIIYFTAHTSPMDYEKASEGKIDRYITKPFQPEVLMRAVREIIGLDAGGELMETNF